MQYQLKDFFFCHPYIGEPSFNGFISRVVMGTCSAAYDQMCELLVGQFAA